jgi:hypothetical protein
LPRQKLPFSFKSLAASRIKDNYLRKAESAEELTEAFFTILSLLCQEALKRKKAG